MAKRRRFTAEFKAEVVLEALTGESSQVELCQRHNFSDEQLSKWKHQFVANAVSLFESKDKGSKDPACDVLTDIIPASPIRRTRVVLS